MSALNRLVRSTWGLDSGPTEGPNWRTRGACTRVDPDLFTSPNDDDRSQARWICLNLCAVRSECLAWAEDNAQLIDRTVAGGIYWTRGTRDDRGHRNSGPVRPALVQPVPVRPTGQAAKRRPEKHQQPHVSLVPHLDEIRALYAADVPTVDIARLYGCSDDAIRSFAYRNGIRRTERVA